MIKAAFFDIDGTLVSFNTHQVASSTIHAIHQLQSQGVKIFLATGRHPLWVSDMGFDFDGFVALNGGYCTTHPAGEVIYKRALPQEDIRAMLAYQQEVEAFPCALVMDNEIVINYLNDTARFLYNHVNIEAPALADLNDFADTEVFQLIAFFNAEQEQRIMKRMPGSETTRWHPDFTDVVPKGGSKALGMEHMMKHYGIRKEETIAFGDGGNDMAMLRHAGIGVAMGNATDVVKAAADFVTTSVDEDGICHALRHFGLI